MSDVYIKKSSFKKKLIIFIVAINIIFTAVVLWIFYQVQSEPSSLIIGWFGLFGLEFLALAKVTYEEKKLETKERMYNDESNQGCKEL